MIAAPNDGDVHLEVLSRLMTILMDEKFREDLLAAKSPRTNFSPSSTARRKDKYPEEQAAAKPAEEKAAKTGYRVLAVTACPDRHSAYLHGGGVARKSRPQARLLDKGRDQRFRRSEEYVLTDAKKSPPRTA
jgi:hypothetical protein